MKKMLVSLLMLLCLPMVSAYDSLSSGFYGMISILLGNVNNINEAFMRVALWIVLFAVIIKGLKNVFPENQSLVMTIGFIFSVLGIRFMPWFWIEGLGKLLMVMLILIVPYYVTNLIFKKWSLLKVIILVSGYLGLYLIISGYQGVTFYENFVFNLKYFYDIYKIQIVLAITLIILYISFKNYKKNLYR